MFNRLPTLKNPATTASKFGGFVLACVFLCSCDSTRQSEMDLRTVLHTRPSSSHHLFDADQITNALFEFGGNDRAAFAILKEASNETNTFFVQDGRTFDTNRFVRAGALYGMGQLGKSVPEATPFLWGVIYSPSRTSLDRWMAFGALKKIGFQAQDIPALAKLLSSPATEKNILTMLVPETISGLIESNSPAAKPYLSSLENLLDDSNPDTQFRAALALVKSEGADNPKIFSALHALFQRPNNRNSEYYKFLAAQILGEVGPAARSLVPDLLEFAGFVGEASDPESVYDAVAKIEPDLSSQNAGVAKALKKQQDAQMWQEKWQSGSYTFEDLRTALTDPAQALTAANHLAEMGAAAKTAGPDMIEALWGKDEDTRNAILADIHKIDPQATVTKINVNSIPAAFGNASSVLDKEPATQQNKALKDTLMQIGYMSGWVLPEEMAAFTNNLADQAPDAYRAFVEGLKPPSCWKPSTPQLPQVWTNH
jgi:hypothetical protein